ncbi:metal-dependent protein hydrolase like protein [Babesia gibsoni]|uniref:Metal-dependent protein hydrolase like protein n=1 Tax=Babesia gibsoni TaxID=33632 RepID=A0AAD8PH44_BABGI|nr:metal-dependent protein hydrolase like protein [Babesia gibsoni]
MRIKAVGAISISWLFTKLLKASAINTFGSHSKEHATSPGQKFFSTMRVCTHSGSFHCDEVLAVSLLRLLPEYRDTEIIRTRDQTVIDTCDVVVDVGGVYDPERMRFDHHQPEFNVYFDDSHTVTRLSSAGIVYKHFAKRIFREHYGITDEETIDELYKAVYDNFIQAIDAIDNGVPIANPPLQYRITTDISSRVGRMNPSWVETDVDPNVRFQEAMKLVLGEFSQCVANNMEAFEEKLCFYITYEKSNNHWRAGCTKDMNMQFDCRLPFPERLCGLRDKELQQAANIEDLVFIHRGGFTCGGKTKESVLKLISLAIEERDAKNNRLNTEKQ